MVVFSVNDPVAFWWSIAIALVALLTDFADGHLARRWHIATETGYFLDGLGDKSFTVAIMITMATRYPSLGPLAWLLITREVALYALRSIDKKRKENLISLRKITLWQAGSIRLLFFMYFVVCFIDLYNININLYDVVMLSALGAFSATFGWTSVFALGRRIAKVEIETR